VWQSYHRGQVGVKVVIPVNNTGRYVRVQLDHRAYLSLAEVKVMGVVK